jgi:plasmid stabilization system protein ParE
MASIRLAESAVRDLEDLRSWYAQQDAAAAGQRILERILESIRILGEMPELGRVVPEFGESSLRALIQPPFRIVYRREPKAVSIVRVWRSERLLKIPHGPKAE